MDANFTSNSAASPLSKMNKYGQVNIEDELMRTCKWYLLICKWYPATWQLNVFFKSRYSILRITNTCRTDVCLWKSDENWRSYVLLNFTHFAMFDHNFVEKIRWSDFKSNKTCWNLFHTILNLPSVQWKSYVEKKNESHRQLIKVNQLSNFHPRIRPSSSYWILYNGYF